LHRLNKSINDAAVLGNRDFTPAEMVQLLIFPELLYGTSCLEHRLRISPGIAGQLNTLNSNLPRKKRKTQKLESWLDVLVNQQAITADERTFIESVRNCLAHGDPVRLAQSQKMTSTQYAKQQILFDCGRLFSLVDRVVAFCDSLDATNMVLM
jgi:hypothetical protein